jgi:hypothetical protein
LKAARLVDVRLTVDATPCSTGPRRGPLVRDVLARAGRYSWDACAAGLVEVYERIASS